MRPLVLFFVLACAASLRADRAEDLARIHVEALGGRERIAALAAMRATGSVVTGGKKVNFTLIAARPDCVRLETGSGGRTLVQVTNGAGAPWEFDTGVWPPRYREMAPGPGKVFAADAEFDDPLIAGASRGYALDYGGETQWEGKVAIRVLVTRNLTQSFSLFVDPDSYLIVARAEERKSVAGRSIRIVTRYEDYRPVDGVLLPHRMVLMVDGRVTQETLIENIEANPTLSEDTFQRPAVLQEDAAEKR
jgi:hypothetical protein